MIQNKEKLQKRIKRIKEENQSIISIFSSQKEQKVCVLALETVNTLLDEIERFLEQCE